MKRIEFHDSKLYTEARMKFQGKVQTTPYMMIDTSAKYTVISDKFAENLGIRTEADNETVYMDSLSIGPLKVSEFPVKIITGKEDGVLGLDFLKKTGAKINLDAMTISSSRT